MADNSKKVSELPVTTNVASTDRVLVLRDPAGSPSVRTITVNNFISNVASAIVANAAAQINTSAATAYTNAVAYTNSVLTSNLVNYVNTAQLAANLTSTSLTRSLVVVPSTPFPANSSHEVLMADTAVLGTNVIIILPEVSVNNGKVYTVKCRDASGGARKVTVMTTGSALLERPNNYSVTNSLDLTATGENYTWVYDSGYYRII